MAALSSSPPLSQHGDAASLRRLLAQERLLRDEAEHRLANLLQLVSSNLAKAARRTEGEQARNAIDAAAEQVLTLGRLQQALGCSSEEGQAEGCETKLRQLCTALASLVVGPRGHSIALETEADATDLALRPDLARCLALVVSELVINAAKHAFPRGTAGRITVVLSRTARHVSCTVLDDGIGAGPSSRLSSSRGLQLAQSLAEEVGGRCRWVFGHTGTEAQVLLPLEHCGGPALASSVGPGAYDASAPVIDPAALAALNDYPGRHPNRLMRLILRRRTAGARTGASDERS